MSKRISSFVMALVMLLSLMPLYAFAATTATVDIATKNASAGETVEVDVAISGLSSVNVCNLYGSFTLAEGLSLVSVTAGDNLASFTNGVSNLGVFQYDSNDAMNGATIAEGVAFKLTVKVSNDAVAGETYAIGMNISTFADANLDDITYTVNAGGITIPAETITGYTAQINTADSSVVIVDPVVVSIGVGHDKDTVFNASEIVLNYDVDVLSVNAAASGLVEGSYTNKDGVLTIEDFNKAYNMGTGVFNISFDALKTGDTTVTLSSAKFIHKEMASKSDLIPATITKESVTITIEAETVQVSQSTGSEGLVNPPSETAKGEAFTFTVADPDLYVYTVTATVGGQTVAVTDNNNGTYTIAAEYVTNAIEITATRVGREFNVIWDGTGSDDVTKPEGKPTYGKDYKFTVPANVPETALSSGWTYSAQISIAGSDYSASAAAGELVTIPGGNIVGDVTIVVTKSEVPANGKGATITGEDVTFADGSITATVSPGETLTIVLNPEAGYDYVITANGKEVKLTDNTGTVTILNNTTISVQKTLATKDEAGVSLVAVREYVTLNSSDGEELWLVTFDTALANGKIPTYDGVAMYASEKYDAYCYLVKGADLDVETAASKLGVTKATAEAVSYNGNVNKTANDTVDAADAQFVANMYNAMYDGISTEVTMPMFLSADMNGDCVLEMTDAQAIIKQILGITT